MFRLSITLGNDAMQTPMDIAAALRDIADALDYTERDSGTIFDYNGNSVGRWEISE